MKERESDDFDPQQRQHRDGMVVGAVSQVPVLSEFTKGVVLDFPAQMSEVANDRPVIPIQIPRYHPNPMLLFWFALALLAYPLALGPALPHPDHANRSGIGVGETDRRHVPNLHDSPASFHHSRRLLPLGQRQRLLV